MSHTVVVLGSVIGDWESVLLTLGLETEAIALYEFLLVSQEADLAHKEFALAQQTASQAAQELAAATMPAAGENTSLLFLRDQLQRLLAQVKGGDLRTECATLLAAVLEAPDAVNEQLETYQLLAARALQESAASAEDAPADAFQQAVAAVRAEIDSPLFAGDDVAALKAHMLAQLDGLQGMAVRQRTIAEQGLALLRERVYRELSARAAREATRRQEAEEIRNRVSVTLRRLESISRQRLLADDAAVAAELLAQLGERLGGESAAIFAVLDQGDTLFTTVQQRLRERFTASYLNHQVTEVLQTMGYAVTQIPAPGADTPPALLTKVDGELGLEVEFDNTGRMKTELVSLADHPLLVDDAQQEKVCSLVDRILDALRQRQCAIRERFRSYTDDDEELRSVEMDAEEAAMLYRALAARRQDEVEIDAYE